MCAPHELNMEPAMSRFNSTSTSKTLIGSEDGLISPIASPLSTIDRKLQAANPIVQTTDNKEWLDLDFVSPKLLRELRRQYDTTGDDNKGPLGKSAAKIKAWSRLTKHGFDIRLRRKISPDSDEVTDFHLVVAAEMPESQAPALPEMPADNAIFELPDTSVMPELSTESSATRRGSDFSEEPLPRYEPRQDGLPHQRPQLRLEPVEASESAGSHQRSSSSQSSIVSTPTSGLNVQLQEENTVGGDKSTSTDVADGREPRTKTVTAVSAADKQHLDDGSARAELQSLLVALKEHLVKQTQIQPLDRAGPLKLEKTAQYETETDVEPPSPSRAKRKKAGPSRTKTTTQAPARRPTLSRPKSSSLRKPSKGKAVETSDALETEEQSLPRRLTVPKQASRNAGAEAVWVKVLQTQGKILGAENPLVFEGRHAHSLSRVNKHSNCPLSLLSALYQTEQQAIQMLGSVHPFVETFSADLKTLRSLIFFGDSDDEEVASMRPLPGDEDTTAALLNSRPQSSAYSKSGSHSANPLLQDSHAASPSVSQEDLSPPRIRTEFVAFEGENVEASKEKQIPEHELWNTWRPPHQPRHDALVLSSLVFGAVTSTLKQGISWLERNYGPEPPVDAGKVRVRWTCSCGDQLYDDFVEKKPGSARALEAYLNRPRSRTGGQTPTTPSSSSSRSFNGSFNSSVGGMSSTQTSWSSYSGMSRSGDTKRSQTTSSLPQYTPYTPIGKPPWLLTCANEDRFVPKVAHLDMSPHKISSDRDLAKVLREHYFDVNRKWWKRMKLRGLTTIEFVQFECHQNRFADIRKSPDMPPSGTDEYTFEPGEMMPPVGPKYLMHLFKHPEDYDSELITYLRAPKKSGRLQLGVGWGINLVEGFLADRVWMLVNGLFAFASLVFAIAWACEKNDIQGAFGVAQWICMLAVFAGGWIQACLG